MKRNFRTAGWMICLAAVCMLAACASMYGPRVVSVPVEKLQAGLARKLPLRQRYLNLIDITLSNPRLSLQAESGRTVVIVDALIEPPFMRPLAGSFTVSGLLAIDAARHAVVLRQPHMDQLSVAGLDQSIGAQLARIGDSMAQQLLGDTPLYVFDPDRFKYAGVQFLPTTIATTAQALVVTFEPVK